MQICVSISQSKLTYLLDRVTPYRKYFDHVTAATVVKSNPFKTTNIHGKVVSSFFDNSRLMNRNVQHTSTTNIKLTFG